MKRKPALMLIARLLLLLCLTMAVSINVLAVDETPRQDTSEGIVVIKDEDAESPCESTQTEAPPAPEIPSETEDPTGTVPGQEPEQQIEQEQEASPEQLPPETPSPELEEEIAEEPADSQESGNESEKPKEEINAENDLRYVINVSDKLGNRVELSGGTETVLSDLLQSLGYGITEDTEIEVDYDSVDGNSYTLEENEDGVVVLRDLGPFGNAARNLILYIDGVAVELELVDPTKIGAATNTAAKIAEAFGTEDKPAHVELDEDVTLSEDVSIVISQGTHNLYLNGKTLSAKDGASAALFEIGEGVTLNVYGGSESATDGSGKLTGSSSLFKVLSGGILNLLSGEVIGSGSKAAISVEGGKANLSGGRVDGVGAYGVGVSLASGEVNVNEGAVINGGTCVEVRGGKLNITGGTVESIHAQVTDPSDAAFNSGIGMYGGEVSISGGTVRGTGPLGCGINASDGKLTVTGGSISSASVGLSIGRSWGSYAPEVSISNADISGIYGGIQVNSGSLTLKSGTVSSGSSYYPALRIDGGELTVKGGSISGDKALSLDSGSVTVLGGEFSGNVSSSNGVMNILAGRFTGFSDGSPVPYLVSGAALDSDGYVTYGDNVALRIASDGSCALYATLSAALAQGSGSISLLKDISENVTVSGGTVVTLDLAGYTLSGSGSARVILVEGSLTIEDSSSSLSGTITGGNAEDYGGGVYVHESGSLTMNGGTVSGNSSANYGGGVCINRGSFTMNGGTISGNTAHYGGGVFIFVGNVTMNGGTVSDNEATEAGGGVSMGEGYSAFTMLGGTISGNTAPLGGGVEFYDSSSSEPVNSITLGGNAVIYGNTDSNSKASNLYLYKAAPNTISLSTEKPLSEGASIGVTLENGKGAVTTAANSADYSAFFSSDNSDYRVYNSGSGEAQQLRIGNPVVKNSSNELFETVREAVNAKDTDTLTMIADSTENLSIAEGKTITLDLAGFTLTGTGSSYVVKVKGNLTLQDSSTTLAGKITGGKNSGFSGGGVYVEGGSVTMNGGTISGNIANYGGGVAVNDGSFTMNGGTISGNTANNGGGVYLFGGTVTLNGGTISGNEAKWNGGAVYVKSDNYSSSSLSMLGGTISGNTSPCGSAMYVERSSFTMTGGSISGNTTSGQGAVYLSDGWMTAGGSAVISGNTEGSGKASNLYLPSGITISLSSDKPLVEGASIGVTLEKGTGAVTGEGYHGDYSGFFTSDNASYSTFTTATGSYSVSVYDNRQVRISTPVAELIANGQSIVRYDNLKEAVRVINFAPNVDTLKLLADVEVSNLYLYYTLILELNGFTLSSAGTTLINSGVLTIQDSSENGTGCIRAERTDSDAMFATVTAISNTGTLTITSGNIQASCSGDAYAIYSTSGSVTVNGGTLSAQSGKGDAVIDASKSIVTINNGTISGDYALSIGLEGASAAIYGGRIGGGLKANNVPLTVYGGLFNRDPHDYVVSGKTSVPNSDKETSQTYPYAIGEPVAKREDGSIYGTLAAAIASVVSSSGEAAVGTVTLLKDVREDVTIATSQDITLDLAGKVLTGTGSSSVVIVNGKLTLSDSSTALSGKITGGEKDWGGGVCVSVGSFTMNGGSISGNKAKEGGGGVFVGSGGSFTMTGGSISDNLSGSPGGGVCVSVGSFTMNGGTISGNKADGCGGGVCVSGGSFTMTGGSVSGNRAGVDGGGGVFVDGSSFTMTGGTISGNKADVGGGVYVEGKLTLGGKAQISGNTLADGTTASNLYLPNGVTVALSTEKPLVEGASIGVTLQSGKGAVTTAANSKDYSAFFTDDSGSYSVYNQGLGEKQQVCLGNPAAKNSSNAYFDTVQAALDAAGTKPDTVTLLKDVKEDVTIAVSQDITLDLAGKVLTGTGNNSVITVNGKLTLSDSSTALSGKITGGIAAYGGGVYVRSGGSFTMNGGSISDNISATFGGVGVEGGSFTMTGGSISGNSSYASGGGVGVDDSGSFTMTGGSISGNSAGVHGGGVYVSGGSFTMTGGSISGNGSATGGGVRVSGGSFTMTGGSISGNKTDACGGGVDVGSGGSFTMTGGSISGNSAGQHGGGVYVRSSGSLTLGGKAQISGNTIADGTTASNLYLFDDVTVALSTEKPLVEGASIGVTLQSGKGAVTTAANSKDYSAFFTSDDSDYSVYNQGLGEKQQVCLGNPAAKNSSNAYFDTVQAALDAAGTNPDTITLLKDVRENVTIATSQDITLDLAGKVLTGTSKDSVVIVNGKLTLSDSSTALSGKITGGSAAHGGGVLVYGGSSFTMNGGSISDNISATVGGGVCVSGGSFIMNGGSISGNSAVKNGGGVCVFSGSFTMNGGIVSDNRVITSLGGGVYVGSGSFTMNGGSISGNKAGLDGGGLFCAGSMTLGGKAQISGNTLTDGTTASNLYLPKGVTAALSNEKPLVEGASIGVTLWSGKGAVTTAANSKDYSAFFTSDNPAYTADNKGSGSEQYVLLRGHEHRWSYSAEGATLTARCEDTFGSCDVTDLSVTLNVQDLIYDAQTHAAILSSETLCGESAPTVSYLELLSNGSYSPISELPKDVGSYKAVLTVGNASAVAVFTISPAKVTVFGTDLVSTRSYDGTATVAVTNPGTVSGAKGEDMLGVTVKSAEFADRNVGVNKAITVTYELSGAKAKNYTVDVDSTSFTGDVNPAQLSASGTDVVRSRAYDGTTAAKVNNPGTLIGVVQGDSVSLTATATYANKNAGSDIALNITYAIEGADAANYSAPVESSTSGSITAREITVSDTTVSDKTYDGSTDAQATLGSFSGHVDGDDVTVSITSARFDSASVGENRDVTVSYALSGEDAANYALKAQTEILKATISQRAITVSGTTVSDKTYDGSTDAQATLGSVSGILPGEDVTVIIESVGFEDAKVGKGKNVKVVYALSGADAANYEKPDDEICIGNINPAPAGDSAIVYTTDPNHSAKIEISGSVARIVVVDADGKAVEPRNVTIPEPEKLIAQGVEKIEIVLSDRLTLTIDLRGVLRENGEGSIVIINDEGFISLYVNNSLIFTWDLTEIRDQIVTLTYDGKTLRAFDEAGSVIAEVEVC